MARLFVPPRVARELLEERQQFQAAVFRETYKDDICRRWDRELVKLDPLLEMVRARECFVIGTPLVPGHYHVVRRSPGAAPSVIPVRGAEGEFIYPPGRLLEQIKSMDLQDTRVERMRARMQRAVNEREARDQQRIRDERRESLRDRVKAIRDVRVSFSDEHAWTQNASPTARRDAGHRRRKAN